jgi:hypothetical protein
VKASIHRFAVETLSRHGYIATCSCSWRGIPRRTRRLAADMHRQHVDSARSEAGRRARKSPRPRAVTPFDRLPEALR